MSNYEHTWSKLKRGKYQQRNRRYEGQPNGNVRMKKIQ